jgi:hypothetical protein
MERALVECDSGLMPTWVHVPKIGEMAVLFLTLKIDKRFEVLKIPCRIAQFSGRDFVLELMSYGLSGRDKSMFSQLLDEDSNVALSRGF